MNESALELHTAVSQYDSLDIPILASEQSQSARNGMRRVAQYDRADLSLVRELEGDPRGTDGVLRGWNRHTPGRTDQDRVGPVGMIAGRAVAGIFHDELQLVRAVDGDADRHRRGVDLHDSAGEQLPAVGVDLEDDARLLVLLHLGIDADEGLEAPILPVEVIDDLAPGMGAESALEYPVADLQRFALDALVDSKLPPSL